jgi:signal transduction histidine kinase
LTSEQQTRPLLSLERRLPLLFAGLLLLLIGLGSWAAYREVRSSAIDAQSARLQQVARQLAGVLDTGPANRLRVLEGLAADTAVSAALLNTTSVRNLDASLLPLLDATDSLPVEIRSSEGALVSSVGRFPPDWSAAQIDSVRAIPIGRNARGYSELRVVGGAPYLWVAAPLVIQDRSAGTVAHLRRIGDPGSSSAANDLLGPGFAVYYVNTAGGPWISLDGEPLPPPFPDPAAPPPFHTRPGGDTRATAVVAAANTAPISIVAEAPMDRVLAGPRAFLNHLLIGASLIMLLGLVATWWLSRRITAPLVELGAAARELSAGRQPREVTVHRRDEIGDLARAFSRMARDIRNSRDALEVQIEEARAARAEAETANRAKSDFLATVSHEIRTPINAIIGYTDLLLLGVPEPISSTQRRQMEKIQASGQYLIRLIDEVLDLSRIEAGRLSVLEEVGDVGSAIDAAIAGSAAAAAERRIIVHSEHGQGDDARHRFMGDARRVQQILCNLLDNSIKFTPAGGRVDVRVISDPQSGSIAITIEDNGVGIPAEQLDRIFEPFIQIEQGYTRSYGGVGLGLAISRELARMMGGDITVRSEPGAGSSFTLHMPRANAGIEAA